MLQYHHRSKTHIVTTSSPHKNSHCYNAIIAQKLTLLQCHHRTKTNIVTMSSPDKSSHCYNVITAQTHIVTMSPPHKNSLFVTISSSLKNSHCYNVVTAQKLALLQCRYLHKNSHCYNVITAPKRYFLSPEISWKAQKYQTNTIFPSTFRTKNRSNFPYQRSSKQEIFPYSVNMVLHPCLRKYHLIGFLRTERSSFSVLKTS